MSSVDRKPAGLLRRLLRIPIWVYRVRLGWLFGHRLVYIAHRGRRTGARREVVAEVVRHTPIPPEVVVIAAWGKDPDWYLNLRAAPAIELRVGAHRWQRPEHRFLDPADTLQVLLSYRQAHRHAWRRIAPALGFPADQDDPHWPEVAARVHAIAFTPAK
ncbi:nitroreductase family deazaflavin-dependent oxidoreductase [Actinophytocola sp.]|uniref:nitroreductase family deazaflavin-dependent oxidoreductase n=1 Tax=Actinophytocola sp. TaxID=1872138 RepID=UPI002D7E8E98|nr:nitroreductase family deazaflavin-dependent oxidoreductase [Actinophytocola sp.]HET9142458.1 nitroreductase family deazaflavin-dependent oxidoreductase [Actinophytocola sp.]